MQSCTFVVYVIASIYPVRDYSFNCDCTCTVHAYMFNNVYFRKVNFSLMDAGFFDISFNSVNHV
jgi:hypothetical protein